jgi:hypothetical protein
MPLILSVDLLTLSRWWVDAAYAVHNDCRGHTGAGISFGLETKDQHKEFNRS